MAAYRQLVATTFEEPAWEERYQSRPSVWSGRPNPQLVAEVTDLAPGRALDVGSGEGADAVWLAERGLAGDGGGHLHHRVEPGRRPRRGRGGVGDRIECTHADLRDKPPTEEAYDLVSAQFMHLPAEQRRELFGRLAAAVAPGGVLLIVGHHPSDLWGAAHRMHMPDTMYTAQDVAADLDPGPLGGADGGGTLPPRHQPERRGDHPPRRGPGRPPTLTRACVSPVDLRRSWSCAG